MKFFLFGFLFLAIVLYNLFLSLALLKICLVHWPLSIRLTVVLSVSLKYFLSLKQQQMCYSTVLQLVRVHPITAGWHPATTARARRVPGTPPSPTLQHVRTQTTTRWTSLGPILPRDPTLRRLLAACTALTRATRPTRPLPRPLDTTVSYSFLSK